MKHTGKNVREDDVRISVRVNAKNYLEIIHYCNKKRINVSQYIRGLIMKDLEHPTYDVDRDVKKVINELFKQIKN